MQKALRVLLGLSLLIALIGYFNPSAIIDKLTYINQPLIFATAFIILVSTLIGACNTYLLVNLENHFTFYNFLPLYWLSWAVGLVFPGQIGDIATLSAIMKQRGLNISQTLGRSLTDKLISFVFMFGFSCWGIIALPGINMTTYWPIAVLMFSTLPMLYWQRSHVERILRRLHSRSLEFLKLTLQEITRIAQYHPRRIAINIILTGFKISFAGGAYWFVFQALGCHDITPWQVIPIAATSSIVAYLPISFNGLGTVEIAGVALFSTLGIAESTVLSAYLTLRVLVLVLAWLPVGLWLIAGGQPHR